MTLREPSTSSSSNNYFPKKKAFEKAPSKKSLPKNPRIKKV